MRWGMFAVTALLSLSVSSVAVAAPPPVSVTGAGPAEGGAVLVERAAGPAGGGPDGWRLNMDVILENAGGEDVTLEAVRVAYAGGSDPADHDADASQLELVIPLDENDEDDPSDDVPAGVIPSGESRRSYVPEDRVLPFPLPDEVTVEFTFEGFDDPVSVSRDLLEYVPPGGSGGFPFAASDLADGEYIGTGQNHVFGSAHRKSVTQRFAYDFNARRWDGDSWETGQDLPDDQEDDPDSGVDENEERFVWGKRVHAIADGTVVRCFRGIPDNEPGEKHPDLFLPQDDPDKMPGGGNSFVIEHATGEVTLYAHLQEGTVPAAACPDTANPDGLKWPGGASGTQIKSGEFLGEVGNSGSSNGPHLHIHTQKGDGGGANGRPLMFRNIGVLDAKLFDPDVDGDPPWNSVSGAAVSEGEFPGADQVDTMLIDPEPRANLEVVKTDAGVAVAGEQLEYTITVTNHGPEPAPAATLIDHLPPEVDYVEDSGNCLLVGGQQLHCGLGELDAPDAGGVPDSTQLTATVAVPHDLVFQNGGPVTITNTAIANSSQSEATPEDNTVEKETTVIAVADLELVSFAVTDPPPPQLLIGDAAEVDLRRVITNHGPSWPMDVQVDTLAQPDDGVSVAPPGSGVVAPAVALDELRQLDETFTITCEEPGVHEVTFAAEIAPDDQADTDPDPADNSAQLTVELECVVPIAINIRPGNKHNHVQPASNQAIPVSALTTAAGEYGLPVPFDATWIDPASVRFGHPDLVWAETGGAADRDGKVQVKDSHELDDKTKDGDPDGVFSFRASETGIEPQSTQACMKGEFSVGQAGPFVFFGCDGVDPLP